MYNSSALTTYHSKLDILTVTTINKAYLPIIWNLNAKHQHGSSFLLADTALDVNTSLYSGRIYRTGIEENVAGG